MQALRAPLATSPRAGGSTAGNSASTWTNTSANTSANASANTSAHTSAGTSARAGPGAGAAASRTDAHTFRALVGQVSRHSGARQVSPWTGEAQAEPERPTGQRAEPGAPRPAFTAPGPAAASGAQTLQRECVLALVPALSGAPREGRLQLLLPGGRTLEISYRSSDRRALVRLRTRHRATARQLARHAESLAIRLGRECLKEVQVLVDDVDSCQDCGPDCSRRCARNCARNCSPTPCPDPEPTAGC